jgi:hypothetical protein
VGRKSGARGKRSKKPKSSRSKQSPKNPPPQKQWERFEEVVAEIQRQLAPDATVKHNDHITGRSGRTRQLDVTIRQRIGLVDVLVVVECKDLKRRVEIGHVEAFSKKLEDVSANAGLMVATAGFDAGAQAVAKQNGIRLLTHREATEADWLRLVGEPAWMELLNVRLTDVKARIKIHAGDPTDIQLGLALHNSDGAVIGALLDLFREAQAQAWPPPTLGQLHMTLDVSERQLFARSVLGLDRITGVEFSAKAIAQKILVNFRISEGSILEDATAKGEPVYRQFTSEGIELRESIARLGVTLGKEEYERIVQSGGPLIGVELAGEKKYMRIVLTQRNGEGTSR